MHTHTFYGDYLKARFLGIRYLSMRALGFELVLTMISLMTDVGLSALCQKPPPSRPAIGLLILSGRPD